MDVTYDYILRRRIEPLQFTNDALRQRMTMRSIAHPPTLRVEPRSLWLRSADAHPETTEPSLGEPQRAPTTPCAGCSAAPARILTGRMLSRVNLRLFGSGSGLRIGTRSGRLRWGEEGAGRMRVGGGAELPILLGREGPVLRRTRYDLRYRYVTFLKKW